MNGKHPSLVTLAEASPRANEFARGKQAARCGSKGRSLQRTNPP
jgi:hypothetical protein